MSRQLEKDQRELLKRVHVVVHWMKQTFRYAGSKQTADFGGIVLTKLARNATTRQLLASDPLQLRGMLKKVARNALIDEIRKPDAGRPLPGDKPLLDLMPAEQCTPSAHRHAVNNQRTDLVRDELRKFAAGEGSEKVRAKSRPKMVNAFELYYFEDFSQAEIAEKLDVSRNTIMEWIDCMTLHIGRRIAERERGSLGGPAASSTH
jgi:DNA-directed RNA polymerase specialized sigma24 family protein